jgi:hypothetical protein
MAVGKKYGGRTKGTPNKATALCRETISLMLAEYHESGLMLADFTALEPKDRLAIAEKMMQYTMPKMQSTNVGITTEGKKTIEDTLIALSQD